MCGIGTYSLLKNWLLEFLNSSLLGEQRSKKNWKAKLVIFQFFTPINVNMAERQTLLIPLKFQAQRVFETTVETESNLLETLNIPKYHLEQEEEFLSLGHVALKTKRRYDSKRGSQRIVSE